MVRNMPSHDADYDEHYKTYSGFVRGVVVFASHCAVILILLAYFLL